MAEKTSVSPKNADLTIENLKSTHELYDAFVNEWNFLYFAYEGTRELINNGYLVRHERETPENYSNRKSQAYGFNYTQSIVDLLNFYLNKKTPKRSIPEKIENDELHQMFMDDSDLEGNDLDSYLTDISRLASIHGVIGILVDKSGATLDSRQEQIENEVYPYVCTYYPQAILDWEIKRNEYGRPTLEYLKLLNNDNTYCLWFIDHFEIWKVPTDKSGGELEKTHKAELIESTSHPIGEIPFIFVINKKWKKRPIGKSDISDIARIDVSIIRNLSQGEEIIDYAAFPMMRKPYEESRPGVQTDKNDDVGPTAVLGFDADNPDSKPDWLESEADKPLIAIKDWIINKVSEIYRFSNIGGMASTEVQTEAKSGVALQTEFQLLNSTLVRKAIILEKTERQIHWYWYRWEYQDEAKTYYKETTIERERTYDVENLAQDLDNMLTAKTIVGSKKFNEALQKKTVRMMLPSWTDNKLSEIDKEIESGIEEEESEEKKPFSYSPFPIGNDEKEEDESQVA